MAKLKCSWIPGFRSVVNCNAYYVFITEYEDNKALYVAERTGSGFLVRAKASKAKGTSLSGGRQTERHRRPALCQTGPAVGSASLLAAVHAWWGLVAATVGQHEVYERPDTLGARGKTRSITGPTSLAATSSKPTPSAFANLDV